MQGREEEDDNIPDLEAERARLDALLLEESARLVQLEAAVQRARIEVTESRIRFGRLLERRLRITPYGQRGSYIQNMARQWGFKKRKADDNRIYAALHRHNRDLYSFARLANLPVEAVRNLYQQVLGRDDRADRIADEQSIQAIENAVDAAMLTQARLNQRDLRRLLKFHQQGWNRGVFERWVSGFIYRRGDRLSQKEEHRGLSNFMMDSGAYLEATRGIEINIDRYCDFLLEKPWITNYINLDKIDPYAPGTGESGLISHQNFRHMVSRGLNPIPVFHAGEPISWLEEYIHEEGCDYIGFGGVASNRSINRSMAAFDECFEIIENCGRLIKTHAFGVGVPAMLIKYPFTSADSASWILRSQRYQTTDISRLGDRNWRGEIRTDPETLYAARTYLEALDAHRFERQIREEREFNFYLVIRTDHPSWLPALWVIGHRNALMSFYRHFDPAIIRQFIDYPMSILNRPYFAQQIEVLEEMKTRHRNRLADQNERQRVRDRRALD
jgi:hypothetical protein